MSTDCQYAIEIARGAGEILLKYFRKHIDVNFKKDQFDPVTQADREADAYIRRELARRFPEDEILSEEHEARPSHYDQRVWMADPLDGTHYFLAGDDSFSVIIGLWTATGPTLGVVYLPARDVLYYAERGQGAFRVRQAGPAEPLHLSTIDDIHKARLLIRNARLGDVRPLEVLVDQLPFKERIVEGSIGTKLCRIASGEGEAFVHTKANASKWDTLGGQVILEEAGGIVSDAAGQPLDYTKALVVWDNFVVATSHPNLHQTIIDKLKTYKAP